MTAPYMRKRNLDGFEENLIWSQSTKDFYTISLIYKLVSVVSCFTTDPALRSKLKKIFEVESAFQAIYKKFYCIGP